MNALNKIKYAYEHRDILRSILKSLYFNFHYLLFKQACRLPIMLYKPKFLSLKGSVKIDAEKLFPGMITLGFRTVDVYPNTGISLDIGGKITFKGKCSIGNNSFISISKSREVIFGHYFMATTSFRLVSYEVIEFGANCLLGWECLVSDSDFHQIIYRNSGDAPSKTGKIVLGEHCWLANNCTLMKNATLPSHTIVASHSLVNKPMVIPEYSLIAGIPAKMKKTEVDWRMK